MGTGSSRTAYVMNEEGGSKVTHAFDAAEQFTQLKLAMAAKVYGIRAEPYSADSIELVARTPQGDFAIKSTADVPCGKGNASVVVRLLPGGTSAAPVLALPPHDGTFTLGNDVIDESKAPEVTRTNDDDTNKVFPIVVLGNSGAGKTSLVQKFRSDSFSPTHITTIGMSLEFVSLKIADVAIRIRITDTTGQRQYQPISNAHLPYTRAVMLVFDVCDRESYDAAMSRIDDLKRLNPKVLEQRLVLLVAAKIDCKTARKITSEEASNAAKEAGLYYFETSAREGEVHPPFHFLATKLLKLYPDSLTGLKTRPRAAPAPTSSSGLPSCAIM